MASFFSFLTRKKIPPLVILRALFRGPLTVYRALVYCFFIAMTVIMFILVLTMHNSFLVTVPASGGSLREGIIGAPKTINPILAVTDTDLAFTHLVYAGLMKETTDGTIAPELAKDYTISPDSRTYTVTLANAKFHDGKKVTSVDVLFTVSKLQNSALNPSHTLYWDDVGVTTPDDETVVFTLPAPRTDFLKRLTIGIMPEHVWAPVADDAFANAAENLHPIGAGAFSLTDVAYESGMARVLTFTRHRSYVLGTPFLHKLYVHVFSNQRALLRAMESGDIDMTTALLPETLRTIASVSITKASVPSTNEATLYHLRGDRGALANAAFVTVLSHYIDKEAVVSIVEHGYGTPLEAQAASEKSIESTHARLETLGYRLQNGTLMKNGSPVGFSIATTNNPDATALAAAFAQQVRALGITVSVRSFDPGIFQAELRERSFSAVLMKGATPVPAHYEAIVPLYRTTIPFVTKSNAHGIIPTVLISPVLRYANVSEWYTNTDTLYPPLAKHRWPERTN